MIEILETLPTVYLILYIALAAAFLAQGLAASRGRGPAARAANWVVAGLFSSVVAIHLFHFFTRWVINEHAPLQSKHEVFTVTGLSTMLFAGVLYLSERVWRTERVTAVLANSVFVLLTLLGGVLWTALGMKEDYKINTLVPALQSYWHPPHVSAYMLGYGSLGLASILGIRAESCVPVDVVRLDLLILHVKGQAQVAGAQATGGGLPERVSQHLG